MPRAPKGCKRVGRYYHCQIAPKGRFDSRSFRTKSVGKKGVKIVIGCPKGQWSVKRKRCKTGTRAQKKLIPT